MSDTTITPAERAEIRAHFERKYTDPCREAEYGRTTSLRLLDILEITEALLDDSVQETRANFSAVYQACTEIITDLKAKLAEAEARAEKAEANVARLTKERGWLANKLIDCPPKFTNCAVDCAECRIEAARRAVAAGER